jgi:hypothetical protein
VSWVLRGGAKPGLTEFRSSARWMLRGQLGPDIGYGTHFVRPMPCSLSEECISNFQHAATSPEDIALNQTRSNIAKM